MALERKLNNDVNNQENHNEVTVSDFEPDQGYPKKCSHTTTNSIQKGPQPNTTLLACGRLGPVGTTRLMKVLNIGQERVVFLIGPV